MPQSQAMAFVWYTLAAARNDNNGFDAAQALGPKLTEQERLQAKQYLQEFDTPELPRANYPLIVKETMQACELT